MSNTEIGIPQVYSASFVLVGGISPAFTSVNFNGTSRLLSIVRTAVGGTVGIPKARKVGPTDPAFNNWTLTCLSTNAFDTSTYKISWINTVLTSTYLVPGVNPDGTPVVAQVAGQYFTP